MRWKTNTIIIVMISIITGMLIWAGIEIEHTGSASAKQAEIEKVRDICIGERRTKIIYPFQSYEKTLKNVGKEKKVLLEPLGSGEMKEFADEFNRIQQQWRVQNDWLRKLNATDILTGMANRKTLVKFGNRVLQEKKPLGVLLTDVDSLKSINEVYGHAVGDNVLIKVGKILENLCPKEKAMAGRRDGGEFICHLEGITEEELRNMADKVLNQVRAINPIDCGMTRKNAKITVGIGGTLDDSGERRDVHQLYREVELALQRSKEKNGNCFTMFKKEDASFIELADLNEKRRVIEAEMDEALQNGEFISYFQPQFSFKDGRMCGAEVLVRWQTRERGMWMPGEFIPIFEHNGFITKLDRRMFEDTCKKMNEWKNQGKPLIRMSLNFSRRDFADGTLVGFIEQTAEKFGIPAKYLEIEVTESAVADDLELITKQLRQLKERGFSIAIDDFGVGYSALGSLRDFPADYLKIDKSFLDGSRKNEWEGLLLRGIISIAQTLNMKTICEGVETEEQTAMLKSLGCDIAQGYYYSRPVPQARYEKLLEEDI